MTPARDPSPQTRATPPWAIAAVLLGILALASWLTTRSTLWDRDEPRFAQAAVEMVQSGQLLFPTFNGELRPDKPILIYWLMAIPVSLFGVSEWAVRAWAPQWNFHPYGARLRHDQPARSAPFADLNGFQYHPNWLHNFLIASSMGGLRL